MKICSAKFACMMFRRNWQSLPAVSTCIICPASPRGQWWVMILVCLYLCCLAGNASHNHLEIIALTQVKTSCPYDRKKFKAIKFLKRERRNSHKGKVFEKMKKVGSISIDAHKRELEREEWHRKSAEFSRLSFEATQLGSDWSLG